MWNQGVLCKEAAAVKSDKNKDRDLHSMTSKKQQLMMYAPVK